MDGAGLGGVRPVKSPPGATTIAHGVLVGWSAARVEHRGRAWKSARELALEPERWAVSMRCERGYTKQLPDLAVWLKRSAPPVAVIAESGGRREDRQKMILEGWRDGILSGRYAGVHYHCASASVAHWISRLAKKVWLTGPTFVAAVQMTRRRDRRPRPRRRRRRRAADEPQLSAEAAQPRDQQVEIAPVRALPPPPVHVKWERRSRNPKHRRRPPSENANIGRSSESTSRRVAADGGADVRRAGQP